ncbi:CapA family protein [Arthrobacter agilis]|uniref:CapA family protein n=1 Tax=Arthrobacter agilis TaxID=37921 RepID=UPI0023673294|nr:CapA family protein [Arthrobacter agilis]WDF33951.1 CapA family protein [Arthrobacter agilis]
MAGVLLLAGCSSTPQDADGATPPDTGRSTSSTISGPAADPGASTTSDPGASATSGPASDPHSDPSREPSAVPPQAGSACDGCLSIVVAGDLLVHPQLWDQAAADAVVTGKGALDFEPLLAGQRPYLATADLAICHLETPVAGPDGPFSGYPQFNVPPQILVAAADVGYDACTTASNHSIDAGTEGVLRTLAALDAAGLEHTGSYATAEDAATVLILDEPEARVAVIGATYGLNGLVPDEPWRVDLIDPQVMIAKARTARAAGADVVLGALHAGDEYVPTPNVQQVRTAHALADSGEFDLVYGHHAHTVQPIENYRGTWILYGLGNAVTELSPGYDVNNEGIMVRARFSRDDAGAWSVSEVLWLPSLIERSPYRWCALAPGRPAGECSSPEREAASRERTRSVVESLNARDAGARPWDLAEEAHLP